MSHIIHKMSFGPPYPGQVNPLDGEYVPLFSSTFNFGKCEARHTCVLAGYQRVSDVDTGTFKYFIKIVPTEYLSWSGKQCLSIA